MKQLFHSATVRLSAWYTLILLVVSLLFSSVVYQVASNELQRGFGPRRAENRLVFVDDDIVTAWRTQHIAESRGRLITQLLLFNLLVLSAGAVGSYLLARYTMQPVEDALEAQTRFSSDAAHELRTPLTIMQSEIEVGLRDKRATKADYGALLTSNLDEVLRMRTLTDRLLMLANGHNLARVVTTLEPIAIEAVNRVIPLAQTKNMRIKTTVDGAVSVTANAESLTDLLVILLENAVKYSPAKSTVTLTATQHKTHTVVQVCDEGAGIAAKDLPHIFDRFYRADTSRSSQNVSGHGLGLSIAQQVALAHGGTLRAQNNPTKGTTFTLSLPRGT
jgi:signal transduction histidine kinase